MEQIERLRDIHQFWCEQVDKLEKERQFIRDPNHKATLTRAKKYRLKAKEQLQYYEQRTIDIQH